jgi:hypothetical protein
MVMLRRQPINASSPSDEPIIDARLHPVDDRVDRADVDKPCADAPLLPAGPSRRWPDSPPPRGPKNLPTFSRSGGNAGALDDDGRFDDDRSHDPRQYPGALLADIPARAAQSWLSCRPWFSLCRERHFHTDASHLGCMPAVAHRCPGRPHRPGSKQVLRQTMQARKLTGKYACSYLSFESDPARGDSGSSASTSAPSGTSVRGGTVSRLSRACITFPVLK